jgi:hypothetical protein
MFSDLLLTYSSRVWIYLPISNLVIRFCVRIVTYWNVCAKIGRDVNAARTIAKRFGHDELNGLPFRDVKAVLEARFLRWLSPDACSASAGRDTLRKGNIECPQQSIRPV